MQKPIKPAVHARREIIRKIIQGEWKDGTNLPSERNLSENLGVTRATLREVLKLIEKEGWIAINHGKPSRVNNFWEKGGLGILTGLNENNDLFPVSLIKELLEVRSHILPLCISMAFDHNNSEVKKLKGLKFPESASSEDTFSTFDWMLQEKIILLAGNRIYKLIFNEFKPLFIFFGNEYFKSKKARKSSIVFYKELLKSLKNNKNPEEVVLKSMKESILIWEESIKNINKEPL